MKNIASLTVLTAALIALSGCGKAKTNSPAVNVGTEIATNITEPTSSADASTPSANPITISVGSAAAGRIDVSRVESAFQSAQGPAKRAADLAVASARAGNYMDARAQAQRTIISYQTTPQQRQALEQLSEELAPFLPPLP